MTIALTAVIPNKTLSFNLRAGVKTPSSESQYGAPNFSMHQRESKILSYTVRDAAGAVVNISTYTTITFEIFLGNSTTAALSLTGALSGGGTGGIFTVTLTPANTAALTAGRYYVECQVAGTGIAFTLFTANMSLLPRYA